MSVFKDSLVTPVYSICTSDIYLNTIFKFGGVPVC